MKAFLIGSLNKVNKKLISSLYLMRSLKKKKVFIKSRDIQNKSQEKSSRELIFQFELVSEKKQIHHEKSFMSEQ